jgi:hypothetical protein
LDLGAAPRGDLHVAVDVLYQSVGYRWATNLRSYDGAEAQRFVRYYADTAADSAVPLARATAVVATP